MNNIEACLREAHNDLNACGAHFALVGALAVSQRTEPRFTRDVDLAIAVDSDKQVEHLVQSLFARGYQLHAQVEHQATRRLATMRLVKRGDPAGPVLDLLFASSGIEPEIVASAEPLVVVTGLQMPVALLQHLIALKVLSCNERRMQDHSDILALLKEASEQQIQSTRQALQLITDRGYHRNQDLHAKFEDFLRLA